MPPNAMGMTPTKALQDAIATEEKVDPDDSVLTQEPPQTVFKGNVKFRIQTSSDNSKEVLKSIKKGDVIQKGGGHDEIIWDRHYKDQIEEARTKFYELVNKGYKPFLRKKDGTLFTRQMTAFDPNAEEIIMVSPTVPG